jgi:translation initiation factor eIF-2B subunit beta
MVDFNRSNASHIRQVVGSRATALETLLVLRQVISKARFSNMEQLVEIIRSVGRRLVEAQPKGSLDEFVRQLGSTI